MGNGQRRMLIMQPWESGFLVPPIGPSGSDLFDGEYHFMRTRWVLTSIVSILLGFSLTSQAAPAVANSARDPQARAYLRVGGGEVQEHDKR
jgi:hypothetical protein